MLQIIMYAVATSKHIICRVAALGDVQLLALNLYFIININQSGISHVNVMFLFLFSAKLAVKIALLTAQAISS